MPFDEGDLKYLLVDPDGISLPSNGPPTLSLCYVYYSLLKNNKLPPLSLANKLFLGRVPDKLKNLTMIEEAMIACCWSKCWIIQLRENQDLILTSTQHGIKGHIIIYPQQPSKIADILPPSVEEITSPCLHLHQNGSGTMLNHLP
jgi:hypothetical protein